MANAPQAPGAPQSGPNFMLFGVIALVVLAAVYYFFIRSRAPPPPSDMSAPQAPSQPLPPPPAAVQTTTASYSSTAASSYIGPSSGFDFPGNDLGNFSNADPNFCADKCNGTPNCAGFIVSSTGQGCYLKSGFVNPAPSVSSNVYVKPGTILPNATSQYQPPVVGHYTGNELGNFNNPDPNFCATKCNSVQGCVAFEVNSTTCVLKSQLAGNMDATVTDTKVYTKLSGTSPASVSHYTTEPDPGTRSDIKWMVTSL